MHIWKYLKTARLSLFLLAVLFLSSSCAEFDMKMNMPTAPEPAEQTQSTAELHFINGNFANALLEYEEIFETALSPEDRNMALYGLACTQMMLARTDAQLVEAISNLQKWDAIKGPAPFNENRHLLVLALKQQSDLIEKKTAEIEQQEKQKNSIIEYQKKKISLMASTLVKLEKQLKELEEIDETFQEKRKPL